MADFPSGQFYIKSLASGRVMQPMGGSYDPTHMVVVEKDESSPIQRWKHEHGYLQNVGTGLCLDYEHGNFKRLGDIFVCQWPKKVGKDAHNQKWLHRMGGLIACNDDINRVLDIKPEVGHQGPEVVLRRMEVVAGSHPPTQQWAVEPAPPEPVAPPQEPPARPYEEPTRQDEAEHRPAPFEVENPWASSA